ncbi:MAG: c-type cytochrome biogenesis protein CcmI [Stellaceae bacterium]
MMVWFWVLAGLLVVAALLVLLRPLLRQAGAEDGGAAVAVFRRQLADIDSDLAQERLGPEEAGAARAEIARRMLALADRDSPASLATGSAPEVSWRVGAAAGVAALLPVAAIAIYAAVGAPADIGRSGAAVETADAHDAATFATAADKLTARLARDPSNLEDWIMLGRTDAALGRFAAAREAYSRAIQLAPDKPQLHAELGEAIVLEANGTVNAAAEAEFAKAGDDPRARFYRAQGALQRGDVATAKGLLQALLAAAPADAPWKQYVAARLAEISGGPPANANAPGPNAKDVAAAQSMTPEQRQTMIRGMVERLAARLEREPGDAAGWARLAHAYDVLGEPDKAKAARARAAAAGAAPSPAPASSGR